MTSKAAKHGMPPIGATDARLLILGSLPGDESIRQQRYYAHPQNQFWRIVCAVFDEPFCEGDTERHALLQRHGIAVWDVLESAERLGSLDTAIKAPQPNALAAFLRTQPNIGAIGFNGLKAAALFKGHIRPKLSANSAAIPAVILPSTSPAAAGLKLDDKIVRWRAFLRA